MMAVLLDMPFDISLPSEARCRLRTEFVHAPERARDPDDARAVLETLHADPSHVPCQMRLEPVPQLRRPRRPIGDEGHIPALEDKLRQDQYMQVLARDRQTGRHGGVRMHYRPDVRPACQDPQM